MNDISNKTESRETVKRKTREAVTLEEYSTKKLPPTRRSTTPVSSNKKKIVLIKKKENDNGVYIKKKALLGETTASARLIVRLVLNAMVSKESQACHLVDEGSHGKGHGAECKRKSRK